MSLLLSQAPFFLPPQSVSLPTSRPPPRAITKCDQCRGKKHKCDSGKPCSNCQSSRIACTYKPIGFDPATRRPTAPSVVVKKTSSIYEKVNRLHNLLKSCPDPTRTPKSNPWPSINLVVDNLPNLLSTIWLRRAPEPTFFSTRHPLIIKVRQDAFPNWVVSKDWTLWPVPPNLPPINYLTSTPLLKHIDYARLIDLFLSSCNWVFQLFTRSELMRALANLSWAQGNETFERPTTSGAWMDLALVFSVCRVSLAIDGWTGIVTNGEVAKRKNEILYGLCDRTVLALEQAEFQECPSIDGLKVLITLLSTLFFETDCGVLACSTQMVKLRKIALRCAYDMRLNRHMVMDNRGADEERRKVWWALVTVDSHFGSTGATDGVISLRESDVTFPIYSKTQPLDLRSPMSRFVMGRFNNRCCELLARCSPFATVAEIQEFDRDLVAAEASVPDDQRIPFVGGALSYPRALAAHRKSDGRDLWKGQQIFYLSFWHIRSKIHRGLLFTAQTLKPMIRDRVNLPLHCDIVKDSSLLLLEFFQHLQLTTAFISTMVGAAITLCLQLSEAPNDARAVWIESRIQLVLRKLTGVQSPVIARSRRVLEYILSITKNHPGVPHQAPLEFTTDLAGLSENGPSYGLHSSVGRTESNPSVVSSGSLSALVDTSKAVDEPLANNAYSFESPTRSSSGASQDLVSSPLPWELGGTSSSSSQRVQDEPDYLITSAERWNALGKMSEPYSVIGNLEPDPSQLSPASLPLPPNLAGPTPDVEVLALSADFSVTLPVTTTKTTLNTASLYQVQKHEDSAVSYAAQAAVSFDPSFQNMVSTTHLDFSTGLDTGSELLSRSMNPISDPDHQARKDFPVHGMHGNPFLCDSALEPSGMGAGWEAECKLPRNTFDPGTLTSNTGGNDLKGVWGEQADVISAPSTSATWEPAVVLSHESRSGATSSVNGSTSRRDEWIWRNSWEGKAALGAGLSSDTESADWNAARGLGNSGVQEPDLEGSLFGGGIEDLIGRDSGERRRDGHHQFWRTADEVVDVRQVEIS